MSDYDPGTYNPSLSHCGQCGHEFKKGEKRFAHYEDYICEPCANKNPYQLHEIPEGVPY